jgi:APA family basic amino acid/polyamine antiporter
MPPKLNTWTLSGLMIGPILGSGVVLLPPVAYRLLGDQAVWAWLLVLALGAGFAAVFIRLALRTKSDTGVASLVAREWGPLGGELASNYLTGAVVFGAAPVLLTAARLWPTSLSGGLSPLELASALLVLTVTLLLLGLTTVSRLALVLSSATAIALLAGSVATLFQAHTPIFPPFRQADYGPALLLLFWAIVGWEVIGGYSNQVARPDRSIPLAGVLSLAAVTAVYLAVAAALQTLPGDATVASLFQPLFGQTGPVVAGLLGGGLCQVSVLMFTGAVTRMTAQRAREGVLPRWLGEPGGGTPRRASLLLGLTTAILLGLIALGWATLEDFVAIANLFFLGNALLGLAAAWKLLPGAFWKGLVVVLALVLAALLTQGRAPGWIALALVTAATLLFRRR